MRRPTRIEKPIKIGVARPLATTLTRFFESRFISSWTTGERRLIGPSSRVTTFSWAKSWRVNSASFGNCLRRLKVAAGYARPQNMSPNKRHLAFDPFSP